jgi:hypothetical protein
MPTRTVYEWVWEQCDEFDDVLDVQHWNTLKEAPRNEIRMGNGVAGFDLALQKNVYDVEDGSLRMKAYAYVDPLTEELDDEFGEAGFGKVPKRFHEELDEWLAAVSKAKPLINHHGW